MAGKGESMWVLCVLVVAGAGLLGSGAPCMATQVGLGSRLVASEEDRAWVSENGTFAFGLSEVEGGSNGGFVLAIWFAQLPGDRTIVWSPNRNSPVTKDAILELDTTGNLVLIDRHTAVWMSNTSGSGVETAFMSESGNFILFTATNHPAWQSFSNPSDTLLPNQPLKAPLELTSQISPSHGGYYTLKMLQQRTSLTLALTYNLPEPSDVVSSSPPFDQASHYNYSYWSAPEISNVTGDVLAILDEAGSFGIVYGESSNGAVYVYKNDEDDNGLSSRRVSLIVIA